MSAEKIINQIKKDAEKKVNKIIKQAEKQSNENLENIIKNTEKQAEMIISDGKIKAENIKSVLISKAKQEEKKEILNAKEKIIDECFLKAHHRLCTLTDDEYKKIVSTFIKNGIDKLGKNCKIIITRDIDKEIAKKFSLSITGETEAAGGIILVSKDERITLDNTFDTILKREKNKLRIKVGKLLFS